MKAALRKLNIFKAQGFDGVEADLLIYCDDAINVLMLTICNIKMKYWQFFRAVDKIANIDNPKKERSDITKCKNYRTISLIFQTSKIILEIISRRLKRYNSKKNLV